MGKRCVRIGQWDANEELDFGLDLSEWRPTLARIAVRGEGLMERVAIVGAGLAGLAAARRLQKANFTDFVILERTSRAGGRVETGSFDGFRLDAGFHVASTSYPAVREIVSAAPLRPAWFDSGVLLQSASGKLVPFYNPFRHPAKAWNAGLPPFSWWDLFQLARLALEALVPPGKAWSSRHQETAAQLLARRQFSADCLDSFWRPFFGGVFLDNQLASSAGLLRYYLRNFILGRAFLPTGGIEKLAAALLQDIPEATIRFGAAVRAVEKGADEFRLVLDSGEILRAAVVILANGPLGGAQILGWKEPSMRSTTSVFFRSRRALYTERCLVLPRAKTPLVRHFVQLTNIDPGLAPEGVHLLSATVLDDRGLDNETLFQIALQEIGGVMPDAAGLLEPLHVVRVPAALPEQTPQNLVTWRQRCATLPEGLMVAGDLAGNASQQNAMQSGVACAEAAIRLLR
jgi:phytoene dehydrogenase-like protein